MYSFKQVRFPTTFEAFIFSILPMEETNTTTKKKLPIINAHSHVFTSKHIPPYLARTFLPFPLFYLIHLGKIVSFYKGYESLQNIKFKPWYQAISRFVTKVSLAIWRNPILNIIRTVLSYWLILLAFYFLFDWVKEVSNTHFPEDATSIIYIEKLRELLRRYYLFPETLGLFWKVSVITFILLFVKTGRNLIFFVFKKLFSFFKVLPGKQTQELLKRYILIAKYSKYQTQINVFKKMKDQYPPGSGFVLLAMDMAYMGAGRVEEAYATQLEGLLQIKDSPTFKKQKNKIYPFVAIDPRRIREDVSENRTDASALFRYKVVAGTVVLEDCLVKTYIETHQFSGFKIYPALGYYPFEKELLPLWKYAQQHNIPITTHCIKGTIFFRGKKEKAWDEHPVFKDENGTNQLFLPQLKNGAFQLNFTHPLNYLCLLEEVLLRQVVAKSNDTELQTLFGFTDSETPLLHPLTDLKINLAHYGGEEHWERFLESDRYNYSNQVVKKPGFGITLFDDEKDGTRHINHLRIAKIWKYVDWYSIISTMMMQYPNVYADISYILHNASIFPLLKETLNARNKQLPKRVLYGTDFYVVRNHNSEKSLFSTSTAGLLEAEFDLISRTNTHQFLRNTLPKL